ncbi:haloacid dehalogenase-like hydrolase domain-containing protein At4g39970 isoform X2 [Ananas comosus]|uniref:Haloacid dehalogenase-like hydrolase domain-containing protein At4g39970 isoform X2 n=1 Tax=Ananas comosus TaxID=4615 RepID=A0A6P5EI66_ANACO|nr:haloacid dehalogenase-like hydrolase domain-containing protein At4g39970 isoform X2 [Ananas comosus]
MASTSSLLLPSPPSTSRRLTSPHLLSSPPSSSRLLRRPPLRLRPSPIASAASPPPRSASTAAASPPPRSASTAAASSPLHALIFDCDGVILESEHLHRQAYNDAFAHFRVRCPPASPEPLHWASEFYDELQNRIGGGKPKMRWYFGEYGWPSSSIFETPPSSDSDREKLVDVLQDWKTERYKEIIKSGTVEPRPGVLRLMDEVKGAERFRSLDCFLAGDDVKEKKPDPSIYITAAEKLGVQSENCLVVEDSVIGLQAAKGAGMSCIITYTSSTANQDFKDAIATYPDLSRVRLEDLKLLLQNTLVSS